MAITKYSVHPSDVRVLNRFQIAQLLVGTADAGELVCDSKYEDMATLNLPNPLRKHLATDASAINAPSSPEATELWRSAVLLGLLFAAIKLCIHIGVNLRAQQVGYGIFRDELYYIVCGRRLDWGYLDNQPVIAVLARLADHVFGHERLWTFRLIPSLAGAAKVLLTGLITCSLGGRRTAQALAMIAVIGAPEYLGVDTLFSMNCLEPVFWMTAMLALLEIAKLPADTTRLRWWITFGIAGGLALETKLSAAFFLLSLLAALLLTRQRRLLLDPRAAAGVALLLLIELPNFLWQLHRGFPTIQWLIAASHENKDVVLSPGAFLWQQVLVLIPFSAVIWIAGLLWLLFSSRARGYRFAGLAAALFIALMIALHAKIYYVVPIYPVLFAAGSVFWYNLAGKAPLQQRRWWMALPLVYMGSFALAAWYWMPVVLPIVPPFRYAAWEHRLNFRPEETENFREVALPQLLADMTSWPGFVDQVGKAYNSLPADVRHGSQGQLGIYCTNYGEASAVEVFGGQYGLPIPISGHQHYWYWGSRGELHDTIFVVGQHREDIQKAYRTVRAVGVIHAPYAMPFEDGATLWLAQGRLHSPTEIWAAAKELY